MAKILFWVNTYNREKLLQRLIDSVEEQSKGHKVEFFIFHDQSCAEYEDIKKDKRVRLFYSFNEHCGKSNYWKLINEGLRYIKDYQNKYDLFIKSDDDMILCDDFFDICLKCWKCLYTPKLFSIDILSAPKQRGKSLKGEEIPLVEKCRGFSFYQTQWVDMNFILNLRAFEKINFEIKNCKAGPRSSGVGLWLTNTFNKLDYEMYQTQTSLLIHKDHPSQMHTEVRSRTPIITQVLK